MYACNIDLNIWYNSYYIIKDNINKMDMVSIIVKILKEHLPNDAQCWKVKVFKYNCL